MLRAAITVLAAAVFAFGAEAADPVLTEQDRSVHSESQTIGYLWDEASNAVFPDFDPPTFTQSSTPAVDDESAADFSPFSGTAGTQDPPLIISPLGTASGSQTSSLAATSMTVTGSYAAASDAYFMTQTELDGANFFLNPPIPFNFGIAGDDESGRSSFSVTFDVFAPTPFHLTGAVELSTPQFFIFSPVSTGVASITLETVGGASVATVAIDQASCSLDPCVPLSDSIDASGVLAPGSYTLSAQAMGSAESYCADVAGFICSEPTSEGSFDLALTLDASPVPALGHTGLVLLSALLGLTAWGVTQRLPRHR